MMEQTITNEAATGGEMVQAEMIVRKIEEREKTGSTFMNEGVALPHARLGMR